MNYRDMNLFFCLATLVPLILFGLAIRQFYDDGDYLSMIFPISLTIITLFFARWCYGQSRRNDDDRGLRVSPI